MALEERGFKLTSILLRQKLKSYKTFWKVHFIKFPNKNLVNIVVFSSIHNYTKQNSYVYTF